MLLTARSIAKSFAGVQALKQASLELRAGEIHALVGENGAGKSTLIKIISGALQADSGELEIDGHRLVENSPALAKSLGISVIYQQPALFPELSVTENLALGLEPPGNWRRIDWRARRARARELLARVGAEIDPELPVKALSMPQQQLIEIARALGGSARVLILDEPTASLSEREVENLFRILGELRAQGIGMIYISHRLDELFALADRVTVLRDGQTIAQMSMRETSRQELIKLMVGRELSAVFPKREAPIGQTILHIENLSSREAGLHGITLEVRAGEILGLAGLVGAGRSELARTLFGLHAIDQGRILIKGREARIGSPEQAVEAGIAYVPEDRRRHGVIAELSISANSTLALLPRLSSHGFLRFREERRVAASFAERLRVKAPALYTPVSALSGGNQQKVALARWLATKPSVLILDEPTQGIDVGAKAEIHRLMCDLAEEGMAVLMISSELPEILGMSDRIAVMRHGAIAGIVNRAEATPDRIIGLAFGH